MVDAKLRLSYALTRAARIDLEQGNGRRARIRAEEARRTATVLDRPSEALLAGVTLARACQALGDEAEVERLLGELRSAPLAGASQFARRELGGLLDEGVGASSGSRGTASSREGEP